MTRSPPATSTTAAHRRAFSSAVRVGDSPVVPATTRVSVPESSRWRARRWAPSTSRLPSGLNGVAMAVSTRPEATWHGGSSEQRERPTAGGPTPPAAITDSTRASTRTGEVAAPRPLGPESLAGRYIHLLSFASGCYCLRQLPLVGEGVRRMTELLVIPSELERAAGRLQASADQVRSVVGSLIPAVGGSGRARRRRPRRPVPGPVEPLGQRARRPRRRPHRRRRPPPGRRRRVPLHRPLRRPPDLAPRPVAPTLRPGPGPPTGPGSPPPGRGPSTAGPVWLSAGRAKIRAMTAAHLPIETVVRQYRRLTWWLTRGCCGGGRAT